MPLEEYVGYPEEFARRYRERGYWLPQTIPQFLHEVCTQYEAREAAVGFRHEQAEVSEPGREERVRLTYGELAELGQNAARRIREQGVCPGEFVLLQLGNTLDYLVYLVGIFWAGARPVFCLPQHRHHELLHFSRKVQPAAHVFSSLLEGGACREAYETYARVLEREGLRVPCAIDVAVPFAGDTGSNASGLWEEPKALSSQASDEVAFLQLSGGTTGVSKLIPRTHADYLYSVRESAYICQLEPADRTLLVLPCAHNFTMSSPGILGALYAGSTLVMAENPSPQTSFQLIEREKISRVALVPSLAQAWLASAQRRQPDLSSLRLMQVGGAKLLPTVARRIMSEFGCQLQQVFGMAEGLVNYTRLDDPVELIVNTQGRPISPDDEVRIVDNNDCPVPRGTAGHLLTRGPYTIRGYYREESANRYSFTDDGFYRTGDLVKQHDDGSLEVIGRAKEQINRGGEKIAVDELENLALEHPAIRDAVALGVPDEALGERVVMVVVLSDSANDNLSPRDVQDYLRVRGLATYKIPDQVRVFDELPLTNIGKVSRRDLRATLQEIF